MQATFSSLQKNDQGFSRSREQATTGSGKKISQYIRRSQSRNMENDKELINPKIQIIQESITKSISNLELNLQSTLLQVVELKNDFQRQIDEVQGSNKDILKENRDLKMQIERMKK